MYYYYDMYSYIIFVLPVIIASLIIQAKLKSTYGKFSKIKNSRGMTGGQAAQMVLDYYGIKDVVVTGIRGNLTDCYDPVKKTIMLSDGVLNNSSIAAVGIACHEAGHAAQHALKYTPIKIRNLILPVCNIGSTLSTPLLIIGFFASIEPLIWIGIGFFAFVVIFQLATLPVEFNASKRAINVIESNGLLNFNEKIGASKVLRAAALTYVASLAVSVGQFLRLIFLVGRRRD